MCLLGMASLAGGKQVQRLKLMPVSAAAAAVPAQAERAAVALSLLRTVNIKTEDEQAVAFQGSEECSRTPATGRQDRRHKAALPHNLC